MSTTEKHTMNRMTRVIRNAISDREIMSCLTPKDLTAILSNAVEDLTPSDVRGFIYRCMTNKEIGKGLIMADRAIDYALEMTKTGDRELCSELVGAAVGTLSILSESSASVKEKIDELLAHSHPAIVVSVIENLGRTSDLNNFKRVAELLLNPNPHISLAAAKYVESCTRDAAFRKRKDLYVIEDVAEEFLRNALLKLESIYGQLKKTERQTRDVEKRLAILVAMMYSEILDSTDWKRFREEQVDERIYYALEEHLVSAIGPDALPYLFVILTHAGVEDGVKRSALHTLGRLTKNDSLKSKIVSWFPEYLKSETSKDLIDIAKAIQEACQKGKTFSLLSYLPEAGARTSMVPRSLSPPKPS
jgi:hypothetical protein